MVRTVENADLHNREERLQLGGRKKPYWVALNEGEHLGYYRGRRVRKWVARYRRPGSYSNYREFTIAEADDYEDADGSKVLNFRQAQKAARRWFAKIDQSGDQKSRRYSVSNALANSPARLRTAPGAVQNFKPTENTADARRRRRSSANRILTILKATLNVAYRNEKISSDDAWRRVRPFGKTEAARLRYLSDDETRRLVNACTAKIRPLVTAALLTGARYSELAGLEVRDFDRCSKPSG